MRGTVVVRDVQAMDGAVKIVHETVEQKNCLLVLKTGNGRCTMSFNLLDNLCLVMGAFGILKFSNALIFGHASIILERV